MNNIGAVVVSYNSGEFLETCLSSLKDSGVSDIVVVDNNSDDNSALVAANNNVRCIKQSSNKGFAAAVNVGVKEISNDFVLLLNPDAKLLNGSLEKAAEFAKSNPKVGVIGFLLCDSNGKPELDSFGGEVNLWSAFSRHFRSKTLPKKAKEVGWVSGGAMLVNREVFEQVNGFDDKFFLYWEDVDFCYRIKKLGYKVYLLPEAKVRHDRGASLDDMTKKAEIYDRSADRYFYKHYSKATWLLHRQLKRFYRLFWQQAH